MGGSGWQLYLKYSDTIYQLYFQAYMSWTSVTYVTDVWPGYNIRVASSVPFLW
jgi:hypothetical protein